MPEGHPSDCAGEPVKIKGLAEMANPFFYDLI